MKHLSRFVVLSVLACVGLGLPASAVLADTTVQGTQSSTNSQSSTGASTGSNVNAFGAGPTANGATGSNANQLGHNTATVSQKGSSKTGDSVAGAQVTGAVADNVTVQNQNNATNPLATSGLALLTNTASVNLGPRAFATGTGATVQAAQTGDNTLDLSQVGEATSGDAIGGTQVTGIVGGGEHRVQNQNVATCARAGGCANSGGAGVFNTVPVGAALADLGPLAGPQPGSTGTITTANAGQIGSNDATISQSSDLHSGDAVFGSQVTGIVGGSATVQNQNTSTNTGGGAAATSGNVAAVNTTGNGVLTGPAALASAGGTAQAAQTGDNSTDLAQDVKAGTGDALSGSQVTGGVGDQGGFFTVQNQQASTGDAAVSGNLAVLNDGLVFQGPDAEGPGAVIPATANASQNGNNTSTSSQSATANTGDALAGSQVTGDVGHSDVTVQNQNTATLPITLTGSVNLNLNTNVLGVASGPFAQGATANASQIGDNDVSAAQDETLASGDAVSGGQITGVVAAGSTVTVENQNTGIGSTATTGIVDGSQFAVIGGPLGNVGPTAQATATAQATQNGDNTVDLGQTADLHSGDAVGSAQVTGVVDDAGATIKIQNQNTCVVSGATCANLLTGGVFGENVSNLAVGPIATGTSAATTTASASQIGSNAVTANQAITGHSGDAVGGSQVAGVVTGPGSDVSIQEQNTAANVLATTGVVDFRNVLNSFIGPAAGPGIGGTGGVVAQAEQTGDNSLDFTQSVTGNTGDAVGGSQVTGVVGASDAGIQVQNAYTGSTTTGSTSGAITGANTATGGVQVVATGTNPNAQQNGDNDIAGDQGLDTHSGDGVSGAQVGGTVGNA